MTKKNGEKIKFTIPPGVDNGEMLRVSEKGEPISDGKSGDLYIRIHVTPDKQFKKEGIHLTTELPVKLTDAILGDKYNLKTIDGDLTIKIPKGIQHGEILRVGGKGVPIPGRGSGDLLIRVVIEMPKSLSKKAKKAIEDLKEEGF
jgi:molecular chaperone DnaJ